VDVNQRDASRLRVGQPVELGPGLTTLPKTAEPVIAVGKVAAITPAIRLTVTELITGKEAVAARLQEISAR